MLKKCVTFQAAGELEFNEPKTRIKRDGGASTIFAAIIGAVVSGGAIIANGQLSQSQRGSYGDLGSKGGCHYNTDQGCVTRREMSCGSNKGYQLVNQGITNWDKPKLEVFGPAGIYFHLSSKDEDIRDYGRKCYNSLFQMLDNPRKLKYQDAWKHSESKMVAKCCGVPFGDNQWNGQWERQTDGKKFTCGLTTCPKISKETVAQIQFVAQFAGVLNPTVTASLASSAPPTNCAKCNLHMTCNAIDHNGDHREYSYDIQPNIFGECTNVVESGLFSGPGTARVGKASYGKIVWSTQGAQSNVWWKTH